MNDTASSICSKENKGNVFFDKDIILFSKKILVLVCTVNFTWKPIRLKNLILSRNKTEQEDFQDTVTSAFKLCIDESVGRFRKKF